MKLGLLVKRVHSVGPHTKYRDVEEALPCCSDYSPSIGLRGKWEPSLWVFALGSFLALVVLVNPAPKQTPRLGAVLMLALFILHAHSDACRDMFQLDRTADFIDILSAGPA